MPQPGKIIHCQAAVNSIEMPMPDSVDNGAMLRNLWTWWGNSVVYSC